MFWSEFGTLFAAALIGVLAVIPYSLRMVQGRAVPISKTTLIALTLAQNAVLFGIAVWLGLLASHALGFGAPFLEALLQGSTLPSVVGILIGSFVGIVAGALLLACDLFFEPYWPAPLRVLALNTSAVENLLASIYGGIDEELLMRFFGLSAILWLTASFLHEGPGPQLWALWTANIVMAILFGAGHLPALKRMLGTIPRIMLVRSLLLNAPIGLACGWLFWTYGIEAAMIAHFSADIVYHVFGTYVLRWKSAS